MERKNMFKSVKKHFNTTTALTTTVTMTTMAVNNSIIVNGVVTSAINSQAHTYTCT